MTLRKVTLTVDEGWFKVLGEQLAPTLRETGEVLRWDKVVDLLVEPCLDCKKEDMDEFACDQDEGYCLDCCGCEEHREDDAHGSWRD